MNSPEQLLNPSEAAKRLGVSAKALRLYEQSGLLHPTRTAAGWRIYGPAQMAQAEEIVALRRLGMNLADVDRVLNSDQKSLEPALAAHQATLEGRVRELGDTLEKVRARRADLARSHTPAISDLVRMALPTTGISVAFDLPWPWGGERFELHDIRAVNYITGPLGSGKTRLAQMIADTLPGATFLGMERADPAPNARVDTTIRQLIGENASASPALRALIDALVCEDPAILVIDMVEAGLDQATQEALMAHLRRRGAGAQPIFLLTRSCAILDLAAVGLNETIIYCPANHSSPILVAPYVGSPGYEAVASCLASPEVRARTHGVIAWRSEIA